MRHLPPLEPQGIRANVPPPHGAVQYRHALDFHASTAQLFSTRGCDTSGSGGKSCLAGKKVRIPVQQELTHARICEALHYEPTTGVFTWAIKRKGTKGIGRVAGGLDADGYWRIKINYQEIKAHRLAWMYVYGVWPQCELDHINHSKTDNRISNLREVSRSENLQNRPMLKNNLSGYRGVHWEADRKRWRASIAIGGKQRIIGRYVDRHAAYAAYCAAAAVSHTHNPVTGAPAHLPQAQASRAGNRAGQGYMARQAILTRTAKEWGVK